MVTPLEHILTSTWKKEMISYMNAHPEAFEEAITLAISNKQPYAWRSAWLLWSCMEENDTRIQPHIGNIIKSLTGKNDNHWRELAKILLLMDLHEEHEGVLFNNCTMVWEKINKKPSVRMMAFRMMAKIAKKHPDLAHEIVYHTRDQYVDSLSPAARKAVQKITETLF